MLVSFFVAAGVALVIIILRAYSIGEQLSLSVAKSERERLQGENPDHRLASLDEYAFVLYFEWLRIRRFWLYLVFFLIIATVETTLVMAILGFIHEVFYPGPWLWGFIAVFVLTAGWTGCVWATLWLHGKGLDAALLANVKRWPGPDADADASAEIE